METIYLSKTPIPDEGLANCIIVVDIALHFKGNDTVKFKNCEFRFTVNGALQLQDCRLLGCVFLGIDSYHHANTDSLKLQLISCKRIEHLTISRQFRNIIISDSDINLFSDNSFATNYQIINTEIVDPLISGNCEYLELNNVRLMGMRGTVAYWNKPIVKKAICRDVIFHKIKLDPYYLATKCPEKSSLDVSTAILIDNWSRLRKRYTGLSLTLIVCLTFLFFLSMFAHSFGLIILAKVDQSLHLFKKIPLWKVLFFGGREGFTGFTNFLLTLILIAYNFARMYMTLSIARLREEEIFLRDSNFNLVSIHADKYSFQLVLDKWLSLALYLSIVYSLYRIIEALCVPVPII